VILCVLLFRIHTRFGRDQGTRRWMTVPFSGEGPEVVDETRRIRTVGVFV
jgi:hypothetical protein